MSEQKTHVTRRALILTGVAVLALLVIPVLVSRYGGNGETDPEEAFVRWAADRAIPLETTDPAAGLDDLRPLEQIVGDARVVGLGESRHDAREQFLLKHRMIRFLVEEMGFTAVALEESLPHATRINEYVLGADRDLARIMNNMAGWYIWNTEEMAALFTWMREYNATHDRKVRFYGVDVVSPALGVRNLQAFLAMVDPEYGATLTMAHLRLDLFDDHFWPRTMELFEGVSEEVRAEMGQTYASLVTRLEENREAYTAASSAEAFDWALRQAQVARAAVRLYTTGSRVEGGLIRDEAMAENLLWILDREGPDARVVVWAFNGHVSRAPFTMPDLFEGELVDMGMHLSRALGDDLVTVAASFNRGDYRGEGPGAGRQFGPAPGGTVDAVLARVGPPAFLLDLRPGRHESPAGDWLAAERRMMGQDADMSMVFGAAFDAVYFVDEVSYARLTRGALDRFQRFNEGN